MLGLHQFRMESHKFIFLLFANLLLFLSDPTLLAIHSQLLPIVDDQGGTPTRTQIYIVHVVKPEGSVDLLGHEDLEDWHSSFLPNTTLDSGEPRLVYSYRHAINGFAARLTPKEVEAMKAIDGFVHAEQDREYELETTRTPEFLGLNPSNGAWPDSSYGEGIIIGVLDSGIPGNPHPSFADDGMSSPPPKWKGICNSTVCNKKIIGAMEFKGRISYTAIDTAGHGTHVASIAAGNYVGDAEFLGMAKGVASGMAPRAHLAIYRVCHPGCPGSDILAGIDQAIKDGVDVITMSIGSSPNAKFYQDNVALGSLAAVKKGISAVTSAGNRGPDSKSLSHSAPWVIVVGASTTDRRIRGTVKLGNGMQFHGESVYQPSTFNSSLMFPLVYSGINGSAGPTYCTNSSLNKINVRGKVVLCFVGGSNYNVDKGKVVKKAGGTAMILVSRIQRGHTPYCDAHVIPVSHISNEDGNKIISYIRSSKKSTPTATLDFMGTIFGDRPSPAVGSLSSRGPSLTNGGILKPDVLAPGVCILGAWPYNLGPNPTTSTFNFLSGTSMAAPHVAGTIALIKKVRPQWSPAAVQSAIITSAHELDLDGNNIVDENHKTADIFATGAGQVNPSGAMEPGLIYDLNPDDYIGYLCGLAYTDSEVTRTAGRSIKCSNVKAISASQLNYPSITVTFGSTSSEHQTIEVERTVTNVGSAKSTYQAQIVEPSGVKVHLPNPQLQFSKIQEHQLYTVELSLNSSTPGPRPTTARGKLEWVSGKYVVRTPIAVIFT